MSTPHDKFFKLLLARPENAVAVFQSLLPSELLDQLNLASLTLSPESFVDEVSERRTDRLYSVDLAGREAFLYVLIEHQSTEDPFMVLRVLRYMVRIWDRWLQDRESKGAAKIPAILPLVVYQGPRRWRAATEFLDLIDLPPDLLVRVQGQLPSFRFLLDDLSQVSDETLEARPLDPLGRLGFLLLRHARDDPQALVALLLRLVRLLNALRDRAEAAVVFRYILEGTEVTADELREAFAGQLRPEIGEAIVTGAERLREEGRAEGTLDGQRRALLKQLGLRFGTLAQQVRDRVQAASEAELDTWLERVLSAQSLEEVLAE